MEGGGLSQKVSPSPIFLQLFSRLSMTRWALAFGAGQELYCTSSTLGVMRISSLRARAMVFLKAAQHACLPKALLADFDLHLHGVLEAVALKDDDIVLTHFGVGHEHALDLHGIDVHALDDDHVVGAAKDTVDAAVLAATGTVAGG